MVTKLYIWGEATICNMEYVWQFVLEEEMVKYRLLHVLGKNVSNSECETGGANQCFRLTSVHAHIFVMINLISELN